MSSPTENTQNDYIEGIVCKDSDIGENEMKSFELGKGEVLLIRQKGVLSALGSKCTHSGAPLVGGALGCGRLRCPWHGASFNILTGDIEDFAGLDSLPCYQVNIENNNVKVRAKRTHLETNKRVKATTKRDPHVTQHIVVIGGGPSGAACVQTLRQEGFAGEITLICKEKVLPYHRVLVTKAMDFKFPQAEIRNESFYKENSIEVLKGVEATSVNTAKKSVSLSNGKTLSYNKLYIATGMKANKINMPGSDLKNVNVMRTFEDSKITNALLNEYTKVVVLGSSFVALEAACYCNEKGVKQVTIVAVDNVPFELSLGAKIGGAYKKMCQDKGITFISNSGMTRCLDNGKGAVGKVELKDGTILDADLVIMGVGSRCFTDFLKGSGIEPRPDGTIEVNEFLQTSKSDVYAGGDIAYAPVWSHHNQKAAIGHYTLAHYHGKIAALNILGKGKKLETVPFFWIKLFGKSMRYAGHGKFNDVVYIGDVDNFKFVAFYLNGDEVVAASSVGWDPVVAQFAEVLALGKTLYRKDVQDKKFGWTKLLKCN